MCLYHQERLAGQRQLSTDDDHLRIEGVHQVSQRPAELAACLGDDPGRAQVVHGVLGCGIDIEKATSTGRTRVPRRSSTPMRQ